ncbi:hypothetical protein ABB27_01045 [Stenotrophomonas terrae]|uniref:Uncharacterized protein n=1 Tax=Stenotrophomonas terrae TaxID=405446 RepID=A0A0R0D3G4_9GAMM|nr:hypothetical protein ABB27_01045 [Stenotrophomonas terrae]
MAALESESFPLPGQFKPVVSVKLHACTSSLRGFRWGRQELIQSQTQLSLDMTLFRIMYIM